METNILKQPLGVPIILINGRTNKVLVGVRKNSYEAGKFGFPGGRVERGETLESCAQRELLEETGLIAEKLEYVGVIREAQQEHDFIHFVYICSEYTGNLTNCEPEKCEGWEWMSFDQASRVLLSGHKLALQLYLSGEKIVDSIKNPRSGDLG